MKPLKLLIFLILSVILLTLIGCVPTADPVDEATEETNEIKIVEDEKWPIFEVVLDDGENYWEQVVYEYSDPQLPSYKGNAILEGWIIYKSAYIGEEVAHFYISDESMSSIPEGAQVRQEFLFGIDEEAEGGANTKEELIKELEIYSESNPATIKVSKIVIHMEGSPSMKIEEVIDDEVVLDYEDYMACENNKFPFELDEIGGGHGQFSLTGIVKKEMEQRPWSFDETDLISIIRMEVNNIDIPEALEYYKSMANRGNTINHISNEKLSFKLGIFENDEFSSSATISETTIEKILNAIETGEEISLNLTQAFLPGMGAPAHFSFACEISE